MSPTAKQHAEGHVNLGPVHRQLPCRTTWSCARSTPESRPRLGEVVSVWSGRAAISIGAVAPAATYVLIPRNLDFVRISLWTSEREREKVEGGPRSLRSLKSAVAFLRRQICFHPCLSLSTFLFVDHHLPSRFFISLKTQFVAAKSRVLMLPYQPE
jgi:hypothetical protein